MRKMSSINDNKMIQKRSLDSSSGACMPPPGPAGPAGPVGLPAEDAGASTPALLAVVTCVSFEECTEADEGSAVPVGVCLPAMSDTSVVCECCRVLARSAGGLRDIGGGVSQMRPCMSEGRVEVEVGWVKGRL